MVHATRGHRAEPPESVSEASSIRLTREQMVARIMDMNTTASEEFLGRFRDRDLREYMDHLNAAQVPRGAGARWARRDSTPGIVSRHAGP